MAATTIKFKRLSVFYENVEGREHDSSSTGCETDVTEAVELFVYRNSCKIKGK